VEGNTPATPTKLLLVSKILVRYRQHLDQDEYYLQAC
jgi:hypothetical protein